MQNETLSSLKALLKHIDQSQLTRDLDGSFHYDHSHWIHFRQVGVTSAARLEDEFRYITFTRAINAPLFSPSVSFRQKIEPFASSCSAAVAFLQQSISSLQNSGDLKTSKVRAASTQAVRLESPLTHNQLSVGLFLLLCT